MTNDVQLSKRFRHSSLAVIRHSLQGGVRIGSPDRVFAAGCLPDASTLLEGLSLDTPCKNNMSNTDIVREYKILYNALPVGAIA